MVKSTRRTLLLGLLGAGLGMTADANAKGGRSGRRGRSGGHGGRSSGGNAGCGSRGGPGGARDANGKCPGWK